MLGTLGQVLGMHLGLRAQWGGGPRDLGEAARLRWGRPSGSLCSFRLQPSSVLATSSNARSY